MSAHLPRTSARRRARAALAAGAVVAALAALSACSSVTYDPTAVPTQAAPTTPPAAPAASAPACNDATTSYDPLPSLPSRGEITDARVRKILTQGYLRVGVSADTYLFGARDPATGQITGFDIDIARAVAKSLFGDDSAKRLSLRVITAGDRLPLLQSDDVDMVARNMSMTCARWNDIAFSAEYYRSGQKVLVAKALLTDDPKADTWGSRTSRASGSARPPARPRSTKLRSVDGAVVVTAANHTGCLVLLPAGQGRRHHRRRHRARRPRRPGPQHRHHERQGDHDEPYGLGFNKDSVYLARYINRRARRPRRRRRSGRRSTTAGSPAPSARRRPPPTPVYGRG